MRYGHRLGWRFLATPRRTLSRDARVAFLTLNPGGDRVDPTHGVASCEAGSAYVHDAYVPLPTVLDNLIADGSIPPVVAVLPDSLDTETRSRELNLYDPFVDFLTEELLPWAHERLSFDDDPARTVAAGSSLGGLAAAFCGLRRPDVFGLVLSQSGAFHRGLPSDFARVDRLPLRFSLDVGRFETAPFAQFPALYHANLHLHDVLVAKGYDVTFRPFPGGHDYFWWRETVAEGLISLLGDAARNPV